jgi:hypothetical protein
METPNGNKSDALVNRIEALLAEQADALIAETDFNPQFETYTMSAKQLAETRDLMKIADYLHSNMTVVEPSAEFMSRLKNELTGQAPATLLVRWRKLPASYQLVAKLGGLTLTAGIVLLAAARGLNARRSQPKAEPMLNSATS